MTTDIVPAEVPAVPSLYGTRDPREVVQRAAEQAAVLADVLRSRQLTVRIEGREYVRIEGWTLLGSMLGVLPVTVWTRPMDDGWEARVEAQTLDGRVVGAAEAMCTRSERRWSGQPSYALRSMAQTRAAAKALRLPLGFVVALAGYEATPAEEMEGIMDAAPQQNDRKRLEMAEEPAAEGDDGKPTEKQIKAVFAIMKRKAVQEDKFRAWLQRQYGTAHLSELSKSQVSDVIAKLDQMAEKTAPAPAETPPEPVLLQ